LFMGNIFSLLGPVGLIINALSNLLSGSGLFGGGGGGSIQPTGTNPIANNTTGSDGVDPSLVTAVGGVVPSGTTPWNSGTSSTASDIQITDVEATETPGQLVVTYTENGIPNKRAVVNKDTNSKLDVNEYRPKKVSGEDIISISLPDATGKAVVVEANYNQTTGKFISDSSVGRGGSASDIQITGAKTTNVSGQLLVTYTENGAARTIVVDEYRKKGPNELTSNEYRVDNGSSVTVSFKDTKGEERTKTFDFNFDTGAFATSSKTSNSSASATSGYEYRWSIKADGTQVLLYRPQRTNGKGTELTLDLDGGNPAAGERSRTQITSNSTVKVNINGKIYSVPLGEIKPATTPAWGSGDNVILLNNETQIATNPSTNTNNGASTLTDAISAVFPNSGSTIASGINADTTPPTTLATT
ncbi:MAG: hypothetical protein ACK48P_01700, partial [Holosporales bacterium]